MMNQGHRGPSEAAVGWQRAGHPAGLASEHAKLGSAVSMPSARRQQCHPSTADTVWKNARIRLWPFFHELCSLVDL